MKIEWKRKFWTKTESLFGQFSMILWRNSRFFLHFFFKSTSEANAPTASSSNKPSKKAASADDDDGCGSTDDLFRSPRKSKSNEVAGTKVSLNRPKIAAAKSAEKISSAKNRDEVRPGKAAAPARKLDSSNGKRWFFSIFSNLINIFSTFSNQNAKTEKIFVKILNFFAIFSLFFVNLR